MLPYRCPLCHQPLQALEGPYRCQNRHSFDRAREGYVNLLPVQQKGSKDPGDSAEMLAARRRFLEAGYYQPLLEALGQQLAQLPCSELLDVGAGEGWYSGQLQALLRASQPELEVYGIDISKVAIRLAAKRYPACHFAVASSQQLPFLDQSLGCLLNIFAPLSAPEVLRVLRPAGHLLRLSPAAEHLYELKALLYTAPRLHSEQIQHPAGLKLRESLRIQAGFELASVSALQDLIQMTPYAWQAEHKPDQALLERGLGSYRLDVWLHVYTK